MVIFQIFLGRPWHDHLINGKIVSRTVEQRFGVSRMRDFKQTKCVDASLTEAAIPLTYLVEQKVYIIGLGWFDKIFVASRVAKT